jgi:glutamate synthase (NADPH/NADH) large chain/glutamate synthase (ferredoxin)
MLDQLEPLSESDAIEVHELVTEHMQRTASPVAERVLREWDALRSKFVKVFPADYKRVLADLEAEAARAHTVDVVGEPDVVAEDG